MNYMNMNYRYFLALGSNLGNKQKNLDTAIDKLRGICKIIKIAPYYKTKPLIPTEKLITNEYKKTFLNTVIEINTNLEPLQLLEKTQEIEINMGRPKTHAFWSPRIIDIDILYCEYKGKMINIDNKNLIIPHKELFNRAFVLDPMAQIAPDLTIDGKNILAYSKTNEKHQSAVMAIVNVNNNSFSGDGSLNPDEIEAKIKHLIKKRVAFIDIGAESTNPHAKPISWQEEIRRLEMVNIVKLIKKYKTNGVKFSIDTYHPETAEFAVNNGFDVINDVNGFKDKRMWQIMQNYKNIEAVIMHSIEPNGNKVNIIRDNENILDILNIWVNNIEKQANTYNIEKNRIIIDYGIGFGKSAKQDLFIINNVNKIDNKMFRVLIGHSRKSFLKLLFNVNDISNINISDKDKITKKISAKLTKNGVDILRLHVSLFINNFKI